MENFTTEYTLHHWREGGAPMTDDGSVYYLFVAGKQEARDSAREPTGETVVAPRSEIGAYRPEGGSGTTHGPRPTDSIATMFSVRMTEATCQAVARAAHAAGKSQRRFLADLLVRAGIAVHPEDLKDRPRARSRI